MLRIDNILIKKGPKSRFSFSELENVIMQKMKEVASSTNFRIVKNDENLKVIIEKPISLQTANKIFKSFSNDGIKIKKIVWESEKIGPHERGNLEVTLS